MVESKPREPSLFKRVSEGVKRMITFKVAVTNIISEAVPKIGLRIVTTNGRLRGDPEKASGLVVLRAIVVPWVVGSESDVLSTPKSR